MKKDWVKKDQSYFGEGLKARKQAQIDKQERIDQAHYKKLMKDREEFPEIAVPGREEKFYEKEERWKLKKKRKKRYKKLWENTIPLVDYRGVLDVNFEMFLRRREKRAEEEKRLFEQYGYYYLRDEVEPMFKGFNKLCYSEPRERRSESVDCECEVQTINHQSNVVMPRPAADTEVSNNNTYDRQRRYDESTEVSVDGNICLTSETDPKILSEEEYHVNEHGKFIVENSIQGGYESHKSAKF
jgi:hypothetical protein